MVMAINLDLNLPRNPLNFKILMNILREISDRFKKVAKLLESLDERVTALE